MDNTPLKGEHQYWPADSAQAQNSTFYSTQFVNFNPNVPPPQLPYNVPPPTYKDYSYSTSQYYQVPAQGVENSYYMGSAGQSNAHSYQISNSENQSYYTSSYEESYSSSYSYNWDQNNAYSTGKKPDDPQWTENSSWSNKSSVNYSSTSRTLNNPLESKEKYVSNGKFRSDNLDNRYNSMKFSDKRKCDDQYDRHREKSRERQSSTDRHSEKRSRSYDKHPHSKNFYTHHLSRRERSRSRSKKSQSRRSRSRSRRSRSRSRSKRSRSRSTSKRSNSRNKISASSRCRRRSRSQESYSSFHSSRNNSITGKRKTLSEKEMLLEKYR